MRGARVRIKKKDSIQISFDYIEHQWLQFDLGPPTLITGAVTRGQGDKRRFVTSYSLSYSNDSSVWYFYKDANHLEAKAFGGNLDSGTERRHYLNEPVVARYVRLHPLAWHKRIGMRAAVLGCPHRGGCGEGFMQVNRGAACGGFTFSTFRK